MLNEALNKQAEEIRKKIKSPFSHKSGMQPRQVVVAETIEESLRVLICKPVVILAESELPEGVKDDVVRSYLNSVNIDTLEQSLKKTNGVLDMNLNGKLNHMKL